MRHKKKIIEVFTEGCERCDEIVSIVKGLSRDCCDVIVWNVKLGCETNQCREKAKEYGITRYPSVVVNGKLLSCCHQSGPTQESLIAAGIGEVA